MDHALDRPCRCCGRRDWMRAPRSGRRHATRFDAETCSDRCRKAVNRGGDLAYLKDWPADQQQRRRFLHQTIRDEIAVQKMIREQRHDYREIDRRKRQTRPSTPAPKTVEPVAPVPQYAPESFFVTRKTP